MSTRKETYIIFGCKFGEEFTKEYWRKDFYDEMEWGKNKPKNKPFFISDGMNGDYTFFGVINQLSKGGDDEDYKEIEISPDFEPFDIEEKFKELYPNEELPEIKIYYLPHWV